MKDKLMEKMFFGDESLEELISLICINRNISQEDLKKDLNIKEVEKFNQIILEYMKSLYKNKKEDMTEYAVIMGIRICYSLIMHMLYQVKERNPVLSGDMHKAILNSIYYKYDLKPQLKPTKIKN